MRVSNRPRHPRIPRPGDGSAEKPVDRLEARARSAEADWYWYVAEQRVRRYRMDIPGRQQSAESRARRASRPKLSIPASQRAETAADIRLMRQRTEQIRRYFGLTHTLPPPRIAL